MLRSRVLRDRDRGGLCFGERDLPRRRFRLHRVAIVATIRRKSRGPIKHLGLNTDERSNIAAGA